MVQITNTGHLGKYLCMMHVQATTNGKVLLLPVMTVDLCCRDDGWKVTLRAPERHCSSLCGVLMRFDNHISYDTTDKTAVNTQVTVSVGERILR